MCPFALYLEARLYFAVSVSDSIVCGLVCGLSDLSLMLLAVCRKRAWSVSFSVWSACVMRAEDLSMHCLQLEICCASFRSLCAWRERQTQGEAWDWEKSPHPGWHVVDRQGWERNRRWRQKADLFDDANINYLSQELATLPTVHWTGSRFVWMSWLVFLFDEERKNPLFASSLCFSFSSEAKWTRHFNVNLFSLL